MITSALKIDFASACAIAESDFSHWLIQNGQDAQRRTLAITQDFNSRNVLRSSAYIDSLSTELSKYARAASAQFVFFLLRSLEKINHLDMATIELTKDIVSSKVDGVFLPSQSFIETEWSRAGLQNLGIRSELLSKIHVMKVAVAHGLCADVEAELTSRIKAGTLEKEKIQHEHIASIYYILAIVGVFIAVAGWLYKQY